MNQHLFWMIVAAIVITEVLRDWLNERPVRLIHVTVIAVFALETASGT